MPIPQPSDDLHRLPAVELWDGTAYRGIASLTWARTGQDAIITDVEPGAAVASGWEGLSAIPGLIDTHVHLVGNASERRADFLSWPLTTPREEQVLHGLAHLQRALEGGITTVRDLSADTAQVALRRAIDDGLVVGPRVLAHGMVGMTAGHGDLFTPPALADRPPTADGVDECRKLVRRWARAGLDGIKVATSGGVLSEGDKAAWRNHTDEELAAIVDEAHALGMRVAAHAHTESGIDAALRAGVDSIEHGTLVTAEQAERIGQLGLTIAPTLLINDVIAAGGSGVAEAQQQKAVALVAERDERLRRASEVGAEFVLGTDANGFHVRFGEQLLELQKMTEVLGYSAERALAAATSRAAAAVGRSGLLGRLAPGHAADVVIVRGVPWQEKTHLDPARVVAVISRGRLVSGRLP
jgi:imidazolonepropionase-like amidohydrolase